MQILLFFLKPNLNSELNTQSLQTYMRVKHTPDNLSRVNADPFSSGEEIKILCQASP